MRPFSGHTSRVTCRVPARGGLYRARGVSDVGKYLTEALEHVFKTDTDPELKWKGTSFNGSISNDEHARLRKIHSVIKRSVPEDAALKALPPAPEAPDSSLKEYLQGAIEKVFDSKGEDEPDKFFLTPFEGEIASQRELHRMIWVERLVSDTIKNVEVSDNKAKGSK